MALIALDDLSDAGGDASWVSSLNTPVSQAPPPSPKGAAAAAAAAAPTLVTVAPGNGATYAINPAYSMNSNDVAGAQQSQLQQQLQQQQVTQSQSTQQAWVDSMQPQWTVERTVGPPPPTAPAAPPTAPAAPSSSYDPALDARLRQIQNAVATQIAADATTPVVQGGADWGAAPAGLKLPSLVNASGRSRAKKAAGVSPLVFGLVVLGAGGIALWWRKRKAV